MTQIYVLTYCSTHDPQHQLVRYSISGSFHASHHRVSSKHVFGLPDQTRHSSQAQDYKHSRHPEGLVRLLTPPSPGAHFLCVDCA
ncbi:hypothetical protein PENSPDRAFT_102328 [Peniophora sp. CONT]|nr:hypothetical protein PENSPDRAFT_102328 [Peniophora sp. CONT]